MPRKPSRAVIFMSGLLLSWCCATAVAATYAQPNLYELTGHQVHIRYSTSSLTGEALLSYRDAQRNLSFHGDQIRVAPSEIGRLVTVTLGQVPDLQSTTLTLLIPDINLDSDVVLFKTSAITTTHKTTIGGPDLVGGAIQTYKTMILRGQASQVNFLQGPGSGVRGEVTLWPTCPGPQRPGQTCIGPYADAIVQILDASNVVVTTVHTNAQGLFQADVPQGKYQVHVDVAIAYPRCPDVPVTVEPDAYASVLVSCDTGIR